MKPHSALAGQVGMPTLAKGMAISAVQAPFSRPTLACQGAFQSRTSFLASPVAPWQFTANS